MVEHQKPKPSHIKGESQLQYRKDLLSKRGAGVDDNTWFSEQRHMADPFLFLDLVTRYNDYDQYFYVVLMVMMAGLLLL
jgi:hypothetical protein